jgi:DNA-directed RNA polymerase subunit RPC12/RpoP
VGEEVKCPKCGAKLPDGSKFCTECGEKIEK